MRPDLTTALTPEDFLDHYWRRDELAAFCRAHGAPAGGNKEALTDRVADRLRSGAWPAAPRPARTRPPRSPMPAHLTRDTVIGPGWTCSQALRAFFVHELGPGFRFTEALRAFVHGSPGRTLDEAIEVWRADRAVERRPIEGQFEYNRFTRAYRDAHPGADHAEVTRAWARFRDTPRSRRPSAPLY